LKNKKLLRGGNYEKREFTRRMKKTLKIERVSTSRDSVVFRIVEQSHRGEEFTNNEREPDMYRCPETGIQIISCGMPAWGDDNTFFVRGDSEHHDDEAVEATVRDFERIMIAVRNYNREHDGIEPLRIDRLQDDLFVVE